MKKENKKKKLSNKELKQENEKLKSDLDQYKRLMILLIVLVLVSVLSQSIHYYALYYSQKSYVPKNRYEKTNVKEKSKREIVDVGETEVSELMSTMNAFNNQLEAGNFFGYLFKEDKITASSFSNKAKIYLALANTSFVDNKNWKDSKDNITIPREEIQNKIYKIFGEDNVYEDSSLSDSNNDCRISNFGYDANKKVYFLNAYGHNEVAYINRVKTKAIEAYKEKDRLVINVLMYKEVPTKDKVIIYKDMDSDVKITSLDHGEDVDIFTEYSSKLQKYSYVFDKKDDHYVFNKIKKVFKED